MKFLEGATNAFAVSRINLVEKLELPLDNILRNALHRLGKVGEKPGFLAVIEQIEECPG